MKKFDKIIISVLIIWTFIHCFLMLKTINNEKYITEGFEIVYQRDPVRLDLLKTDLFYPFTKKRDDTIFIDATYFNLKYYDYSEFFAYVVGAWTIFFIYNLIFSKNKYSLNKN